MEPSADSARRKRIGRLLGIVVSISAIVLLILVVAETNRNPRTDDASVRANFIEIAPEVNGRLIHLPVKDNAHVAKGDLLFEIDPRPYQYALEQALSDQAALEQQIIDESRKIAAEQSAVEAAQASLRQSVTGIKTAGTNVEAAAATILRSKAAVAAAEAQLKLATNNLQRIEPLLKKQYVTVEQVDQTRTAVFVAQGNLDEAKAALVQAEAQEAQSLSRRQEADAATKESQAKLGQAVHTIDRLDTILSLRPGKAARVESARLDLERTRVLAPFDAYVTNMNISEGAYASAGRPMFTLIDARNWYVIANYRESKVRNIKLGAPVDVYVMGHPDRRFDGVVESIGYGVFPEDGSVVQGLPNIERTLNWVHLSTRFPVRIHISSPDPDIFRMGATAVTVVR